MGETYKSSGIGPYLILLVSMLSISSAGSLMKLLSSTPPLLKAFWRLFVLSTILLLGAIWQYRRIDPIIRERYCSWRTFGIMTCSGAAIALHFGAWIWSLDHTSLAHSLFFVCSHPIVIVAIMLLRGAPINRWEVGGSLIGLVGTGLMLADANSEDKETTIEGDLMAFLGALAMVAYLFVGRSVRQWCPLFLYTFPINFIASILLLVAAIPMEHVTWGVTTGDDVLGFFAPAFLPILLLIVLGPGLLGHTGINYVLSRVSPLAVSLSLTLEPVTGVIVGMAFGFSTHAQTYTLAGGPLILVGCLMAVYGTHRREQTSQPIQHADIETETLQLTHKPGTFILVEHDGEDGLTSDAEFASDFFSTDQDQPTPRATMRHSHQQIQIQQHHHDEHHIHHDHDHDHDHEHDHQHDHEHEHEHPHDDGLDLGPEGEGEGEGEAEPIHPTTETQDDTVYSYVNVTKGTGRTRLGGYALV